ncbi:MAG: HNH endonuclease [Citrobacter portucalensis]|nr:HNH endonuclease [Citrobacter portucalensis]
MKEEIINKWNEIFYLDGKDLKWKKTSSNFVKNGSVAGGLNDQGYRIINFGDYSYRAHRIVWEMHNGPIPEGMSVDHLNHVRDDNRIENLRLVSHRQNMMNMAKSKANTSGVTGVHWFKSRNKWVAKITVKGKSKTLGYFSDFQCAVNCRKKAEKLYGFHENHGK